MAISVNKVILVGRVGNDPEMKGSGDGFATLSLATSRSWKNDRGDREEKTEWHKVVVFNKQAAKFVDQYVRKGDLLYVEGRLETRKYQKDGTDVYITEVIVPPFEGVVQLQSKERGSDSGRGERRERSGGGGFGGQPDYNSHEYDDEIPF